MGNMGMHDLSLEHSAQQHYKEDNLDTSIGDPRQDTLSMSHNAKIPGSVLLFFCGPFVAMKITEALPVPKPSREVFDEHCVQYHGRIRTFQDLETRTRTSGRDSRNTR